MDCVRSIRQALDHGEKLNLRPYEPPERDHVALQRGPVDIEPGRGERLYQN